MTQTTTTTSSIEGFGGDLLLPGEPAYDAARQVFNAMVDRRPVAVARCASTQDVATVVRHAVRTRTPLTVYGGGHAVTGSAVADGALCLDLRGLKAVEIDHPPAACAPAAA